MNTASGPLHIQGCFRKTQLLKESKHEILSYTGYLQNLLEFSKHLATASIHYCMFYFIGKKKQVGSCVHKDAIRTPSTKHLVMLCPSHLPCSCIKPCVSSDCFPLFQKLSACPKSSRNKAGAADGGTTGLVGFLFLQFRVFL